MKERRRRRTCEGEKEEEDICGRVRESAGGGGGWGGDSGQVVYTHSEHKWASKVRGARARARMCAHVRACTRRTV